MEGSTALAVALANDPPPTFFMPGPGETIQPPGLLGVGGTTQTLAMRQLLKAYPHIVGPRPWICDSLRILVGSGTTPAGGTDVVLDVGIFGDDGTGFPDFETGALATAQFNSIMSNGAKTANLSEELELKPGVYWPISRLDWSVAPTTYPQLASNANSTWQLGIRVVSLNHGPTRGFLSNDAFNAIPSPASGLTRADFSIDGGSGTPIFLLHRKA